MPYGIILLPEPDVSERFLRYSNEIASLASPIMSLGEAAPAHLTLVHVECDRDVAESCWNRVLRAMPPATPVSLVGLIFAPIPKGDYYVPGGGLSYGLEAIRRSELEFAHKSALQSADAVGAEILNPAGQDFRPHITLGVLDRFPVGAVNVPPQVVLTSFVGRVALGRLGPFGTFPEIITRA
jgi:hypothetical protein